MAAGVESTLVNIYSQPNARGRREMSSIVASDWKEETESWNWRVTVLALRRSFERPFHGIWETIDYDQVGANGAWRLGPAEFPVL